VACLPQRPRANGRPDSRARSAAELGRATTQAKKARFQAQFDSYFGFDSKAGSLDEWRT
jgi:hypothetical protein